MHGARGSVACDHDRLAVHLEKPRADVNGTRVAFVGLHKPDERGAVTCCLDTLE